MGRERSAMQTRTPTEQKNLRSHGSFVSFTMKVEAERKTELPTDSVVYIVNLFLSHRLF